MSGVITACLKPDGTVAVCIEVLTNFVTDGKRVSMQLLTRDVGIGSNSHDFEGALRISFLRFSCEIPSRRDN